MTMLRIQAVLDALTDLSAGRACGPPKTQGVRSYVRAAPPKQRKRKPAAVARAYWTCVRGNTGRTCGVHHASSSAAFRHEKRLNLISYRAGTGRPWHYEKRGG